MRNIKPLVICILISLISIHGSYSQTIWQKYHSSIKLGIGYCPVVDLDDEYDLEFYPCFSTIYQDKTCHYPAINLSYSYSLSRKIDVEMMLGYTSKTSMYRNIFTDDKEGKFCKYIFFASPRLNYYWSRRGSFSLYSSFGLSFVGKKQISKDNCRSERNDNSETMLNVTFFGVTFGKRIYGFAEFGAGASGCIQSGLGYRF